MRFTCVGVLCGLLSTPLLAEPVFLQHRVADPLNLMSAIPAHSSPNTDGFQLQVSSSYVNVFSGGGGMGEGSDDLLVMDGEIGQLELRGQWALNACFSVAFDSRLINHSGGFLDDAINAWHQFFRLPDADRELSLFDSLTYFYSSNGVSDLDAEDFSNQQIRLQSSQRSLGDLWLSVQKRVQCAPSANLAEKGFGHVRLGVKVPLDRLSDNVSAWASGGQNAVFIDWHADPCQLGKKVRVTSAVGFSYSNEWDERFAALPTRSLVGYGTLALDYRWNRVWQTIVQLDVRSPTFESELSEIGQWGAQLHVGARLSLSATHQLEFSFVEDVVADTAPDIGARVAYSYTR